MKVLWGALIVDGRGKLGGHVASKNRAGAYLRTKVTPVNPQTSFQTSIRNLFASLSTAWSGLTQAARDGWDGAVENWQDTNIFGNLKTPTGKNLYLKLNQIAQLAGWPAIALPPAKAELPPEIYSLAVMDLTLETLDFAGKSISPDVRLSTRATPVLTQGTTFVKNRLRKIYSATSVAYDESENYQLYTARFGVPVVGDNLYIGITKVLANGQASPEQTLKVTVQV